MAHAISPANTTASTASAVFSATADQPDDKSIFSALLSQLQPATTDKSGLPAALNDLLAGSDAKTLADDKSLPQGGDLSAALQLLMQGYNPQAQVVGDRQKLPAAAAFAGKALSGAGGAAAKLHDASLLQQNASKQVAAGKLTPAATVAAQQGSDQALGKLNEMMQHQQTEPAIAPVATASRRADPLPGNVRLMFRPEQRADGADLQADKAAAQVDSSQSMLSSAASSLLPNRGHENWQEIRQPMAQGSTAWRQEFAEKLGNLVQFKLDSASIKVTPEHLGPLDISITFDQQDRARISVVAANHAAREIVESGLPQLGKMLEQSGIQVSNVEVSSQAQQQQARDQGAQWQQGQHQGQHRGQPQEPFIPQNETGVAALAGDLPAGIAPTTALSEQLSIRA
ncbi:flagellar hook-length control protein FliK [Vogesella oryzae]|uniref:flagellar hook-length control protein FliK n=1 Tax=Vogesella oryzae TaxID=1735285 RepID=UPI0015843380|nr:flagellar hook-length control protein FliK [Vogesella oryzae]